MIIEMVRVIGGGLAGSEAAWQAASMGVHVVLHEMRPVRPTAVHKTDGLAELVCSNSFRGDKLDNAVGLLKEEMRRLGSLVMRVADTVRVPAGAALAVDRQQFSAGVTEAIHQHPLITVLRGEIDCLPPPTRGEAIIVATGPLTSDRLSADIATFVGRDQLAFFDAISPIVLAETIELSKVFRASRWNRNLRGQPVNASDACVRGDRGRAQSPVTAVDRSGRDVDWGTSEEIPDRNTGGDSSAVSDGDYLNCPMTKDEYRRFHEAIVLAEKAAVHDFDNTQFFEGCLPIEVLAHRGLDTLRFGPMKASGLTDPRTGRWPHAVVQLRQDNLAADHYSLVGFQTQLQWGEQVRVFRMIPGLEKAEFVRLGMIHRNTYINAPTVLDETWCTRARPDLFFAGQVSGVEGYVESAASGLIAGRNAARVAQGLPALAAPRTTAIGALGYYVSHADPRHYAPSNITFGIMPALDAPPRQRVERQLATSRRALDDLARWMGVPAAAAC